MTCEINSMRSSFGEIGTRLFDDFILIFYALIGLLFVQGVT
jgi:hypothetical protein